MGLTRKKVNIEVYPRGSTHNNVSGPSSGRSGQRLEADERKDSKRNTKPVGSDAPTVTPSKSELGLTDELAAVPIHAGDDVLTLEDAARHLYHARLRDDAEQVGDDELQGAAQALEESTRAVVVDS